MAIADFSVSPRQAKRDAMRVLEQRLVPFLRGSPGVAKSAIAREISEAGNLLYIDVRASMLTPEDFMGLPMRSIDPETGRLLPKGEFVPFSHMFPIEGVEIPAGYSGWLLNMDEFNSANRSIQAASYKIILDRYAGQHKLHDMCFVMAAGNQKDDRAIVNELSTAMQSRLIHINVHVDVQDWLTWAYANDIDYRVTGYVQYMNEDLHNFDPNHDDNTFPCPRTWEFVSKLIKGVDDLKDYKHLLVGTVGQATGVKFHHFAEEFQNLPMLAEILADPAKARLPKELSTRFATISHLIAHIDSTNSKQIVTYIDRFEEEEKVIFFRSAVQRNPKMQNDTHIQKNLMKVMKFLNAD